MTTDIDLTRFHASFFEEALEHTRTLEEGLVALEERPDDNELLNALFRAAHSVKGASGSLGFDAITRLTHVMENLLDGLRSGHFKITHAQASSLLEATDGLRGLILHARDGAPAPATEPLVKALEVLTGQPSSHGQPAQQAATTSSGEEKLWEIVFRPAADIFAQGMDPMLVVRELLDQGDAISLETLVAEVPALDVIDPERCYLGWRVRLKTKLGEKALRDVFMFVEDGATLELKCEAKAAPDAAAISLAPRPTAPGSSAIATDVHTLRVATEKVDRLINLVGELVIAQAMVNRSLANFTPAELPRLREAAAEMERHTRDLQDRVMNIRMVPIGSIFGRFKRLVRDLSSATGKGIELQLFGEETELDKSMVEHLADPLTHLVRNAADHGLETPDVRVRAGKNAAGKLSLSARHQGGNVVIDISDDGHGLNTERIRKKAIERGLIAPDADLPDEAIHELIFAPGFSTAEQVTDLSGRGVGMDVVKRSVELMNGQIAITTQPGRGTRFRISLPLTLAILDGMALRVGKSTFVVPLNQVIETLPLGTAHVTKVVGSGEIVIVRGESLPFLRLAPMLGLEDDGMRNHRPLAVVLEAGDLRFALAIDELLGQAQFVIKSLEPNFHKLDGVLGATILGDGTVSLILDVPSLARMGHLRARADGQASAFLPADTKPEAYA